MASLLKVGRGAVRILSRRTVPASLPRVPALDPVFDYEVLKQPSLPGLLETCTRAASKPAKPRPVLPMEMRYDIEQDVPILCQTTRPYLVHLAKSEPGLVHSDLNKYWVVQILQELYTEAAGGQAGQLGDQMDTTLQAFRKFGSLLIYQMGICSVRGKDGKLSVVVDEKCNQTLAEQLEVDRNRLPMAGYRNTGYSLHTVPKTVFDLKAFEVVNVKGWWVTSQSVRVNLKGEEAKIAVEIDRSALGQGNLLFFLPPAAAKNKFEVFAELVKAGDDIKGLELVELPSGPWDMGCWYKLWPVCEQLPWITPREKSALRRGE